MNKLRLYLGEAYDELLYKVTWPTWGELQSSSVVVILASLIIAFTVFFMDFVVGANPENSVFHGLLYYVYQFLGGN